ncbi:hypothetical protein DES43_1151, partial [Aquamicrobium defluvii]
MTAAAVERVSISKGDLMSIANETAELLCGLGVLPASVSGGTLVVRSPVTGEELARVGEVSG